MVSIIIKCRGVLSGILVILILVFCLEAFVSAADDPVSGNQDQLRKKLAVLRNEITQVESNLSPLVKQRADVKGEQARLEKEIRVLSKNQKEIAQQVVVSQEALEKLQTEAREIQTKEGLQRNFLEKRLAYMYKTRRGLAPLAMLLKPGDARAIFKRFTNLKFLVKSDVDQLTEYAQLKHEVKVKTEAVEASKGELERNHELAKHTSLDIEARRLELAKTKRKLRHQIEEVEVSLVKLRRQETEYESLIQELFSSIEKQVPIRPKPQGGRHIFRPHSFALPVSGVIVQHFGKQKHSQFSETINVKGVEVSAPVNSPVRVVGNGEVVFNAILPGFGNVVIVDHGDAYFSLYGRILPSKARGDVVLAGDILGSTSTQDDIGRNFYFEVRKDGKPQNPEKYLRK